MDEQSDGEFLEFIEDTLIPDLHQGGQHEVAKDLDRLTEIIRSEERWLELRSLGYVRT